MSTFPRSALRYQPTGSAPRYTPDVASEEEDALEDEYPREVRTGPVVCQPHVRRRYVPVAERTNAQPLERQAISRTSRPASYVEDQEEEISTTALVRVGQPTRSVRVSIGTFLLRLGIAVLILIAVWELLILPVVRWSTNHWNYGSENLVQVTAVVGHHDSAAQPSVFLTMHTQNNQVEIVEFPGGDLHHAISYPLNIASSDPVTLTFQEDAQHPGKPNLVAQVGDNTIVLFNTGKAFSPTGK